MSKTLSDSNAQKKAIKKMYDEKIIEYLQALFDRKTFDSEKVENVKLELLEDKSKIIREVAIKLYDINDHLHTNKKLFNYELDKTLDNIILDIDTIYIKQYKKYFQSYDLKQKVQKEYIKELIYNKIKSHIEFCKNKKSMKNILYAIKTSEYKKALYDDLYKQDVNFNENIANEFYHTILNKVIRDYKNDPTTQENDPDINIPLGWKIYGIVKAFGVINKKIWK